MTPLDLKPGCNKLTGTGADPALSQTSGWQWGIDLTRTTLDSKVLTWDTVLERYCPISIALRWRYSDNARDPWRNVFKGYAWKIKKGFNGFQKKDMTITVRDELIRISNPAGRIDKKYGPMEFLKQGADIFGGEMFQEMRRIELGSEVSGALNFNGDPLRYDPTPLALVPGGSNFGGYYPLVEARPAIGPLFPAPYDSCLVDWAKAVAKKSRCMFFVAQNPNPALFPCLVWANYRQWV